MTDAEKTDCRLMRLESVSAYLGRSAEELQRAEAFPTPITILGHAFWFVREIEAFASAERRAARLARESDGSKGAGW